MVLPLRLWGPGRCRQLAAERSRWLPFLLRTVRERIAFDLARYSPDTDMLRCAIMPFSCGFLNFCFS